MASKTNKPMMYEFSPVSIMPAAASTTYDLDMDPGNYSVAAFVTSSVTGITTDLRLHQLDKNGDIVDADVGADGMAFMPSNGTGVTTAALVLPAGANRTMARYTELATNLHVPNVGVINGLRLTVTKGGAVTGEQLEVVIVAVRQ